MKDQMQTIITKDEVSGDWWISSIDETGFKVLLITIDKDIVKNTGADGLRQAIIETIFNLEVGVVI